MSSARAAIAGVISTILIYEAVNANDIDRELLIVVVLLLAVIALLIVPDAVDQYRKARGKEEV